MELLTKENLSKIRTMAIFGNVGSGKTSLAYKILDTLRTTKPIYFLRHPKPDLIAQLKYNNLDSIEEIEHLQDCIIYIDEPQLHLGIQDKKSNMVIAKLCSLARQRDITLIISSSDTRVFGKSNEAFFDTWFIKNISYDMVKRGSKIKNIIKKNCLIEPEGFRLNDNEFLFDSIPLRAFNRKQNFVMLPYFNDALSKPYRL